MSTYEAIQILLPLAVDQSEFCWWNDVADAEKASEAFTLLTGNQWVIYKLKNAEGYAVIRGRAP